jgi:hypothetical protein
MSERMKTFAEVVAERVAVRFLYQVSGYVSGDVRRLMYAQVKTTVLHEIERLVREMEKQRSG